MIVIRPKPIDEILGFLNGHKSVLIAGCDGCTHPPRGLREAHTYVSLLGMAAKLKGMELQFKPTTIAKTCDKHVAYTTLEPQLNGVDAILSLACGIGVQVLNEVFPQLPTYPANDTVFNGMQEKEGGIFEERCKACGNCILGETGGICPIARCSKGLLNGPCGGHREKKCEVKFNGEEHDCARVLIFERLRDLGKLENFLKFREPKDWSLQVGPRKTLGV